MYMMFTKARAGEEATSPALILGSLTLLLLGVKPFA